MPLSLYLPSATYPSLREMAAVAARRSGNISRNLSVGSLSLGPPTLTAATTRPSWPNTGAPMVVADFTGVNRLTFPAAIGSYTEEQRQGLVDLIARYMINVASGGLLDQ